MITKHFSPNLPFLPRFALLPPLSQWCRRTGDGHLRVRSWSVCNISSTSFLSLLLPCSSMGSTPWDSVSHKLLQSGSSSCWGGPSGRLFSMDPRGPQLLPETCFCMGYLGCSFLQGSSIHLLSVGASRLSLRVSAPVCYTVGFRCRACFPII